MNLSRALAALMFELRLMRRALTCRGCFVSKIVFAAGAGYMFGPWDLIPNRLPVIGYSDQAGFLIAGLLLARFFIPVEFDVALAGRRAVCAGGLGRARAELQSASLVQWLAFRRRLRRLGRRLRHLQVAGLPSLLDNRPKGGLLFGLLGYRLWWRLRAGLSPRTSGTDAIIVIGGSARSGTTLLRTMLGRHSMIASCPETTVFLKRISSPAAIAERLGWDAPEIEAWQRESRSQVDFIARFADAVRARTGKPIWVEKTPKNVLRFGFVRRRFPRARIVHIVRDGRDVVCSLRRKPFAKIDAASWDGKHAARRCAVQWRNSVKAGLRFRGDPMYYELRYEDLVHQPEATLRALLAFLGLPWDAAMLAPSPTDGVDPYESRAAEPIFDSSIGRWRADLSDQDRRATLLLIGPQLMDLGYQAGLAWDAREPASGGLAQASA